MAEQQSQQNQQNEISLQKAVDILYRATRKVGLPVDDAEPATGHELCNQAGAAIMRYKQYYEARIQELENAKQDLEKQLNEQKSSNKSQGKSQGKKQTA